MEVPRIQELIEIHTGYASFVDLETDLFDDTRNAGRMASYRPITTHRVAFQKLARSLNIKDIRCYLLTGSYGTGKSHLSLMFANYLQTPANAGSMPEFFRHYAALDPHKAEELKTKRLNGSYLIALCAWGGHGDFEDVILRAIDTALKRDAFIDDTLNTPYLQARKKMGEWATLVESGDARGHFYSEFEQALTKRYPGQTLASLDKRLAAFDHTALEEFKRLHQEVTTAPFAYDNANLLDILTSILASDTFKERYEGILVLFDEFGDTMESGRMSPKMFQRFAQLCTDTPQNCARIMFVGTAHHELTHYATPYNQVDFRTARDRIEEIGLTPDGVEDIVAAIVVPQKNSIVWQQKIAQYQTFDEMLSDCIRLKLFSWLKAPQIREKIIENMYPMHPIATYALLQLGRDIASNNRTVFKFFSEKPESDADLGSYGQYIANTPIESAGKLNLYTADRLFDYFATQLQSDNKELRDTIRRDIRDYENSVREQKRVAAVDATNQLLYQEDSLVTSILRLMLIYQIIQIANTPTNLAFGLYCVTSTEKEALYNRLRELAARGVLYHRKDLDVYEFKQSGGADIDQLVARYIADPDHLPSNIAAELNVLVPFDKKDGYLEAKDYNSPFSEDKRLERRFIRAVDMEAALGGQTYFDGLDIEIGQEIEKKNDFEGVALYVICETSDEIQKARDLTTRNMSDRIVIAIPKQPFAIRDAILELKALQAIETHPEAKNFTMQDRAALNAKLNGNDTQLGAKRTLLALRDKFLSARDVIWYRKYGQAVQTEVNKAHDAANRVMEVVYGASRNQFPHDDFNKLHVKIDRSRNAALKEAVEKLLDITNSTITIETSFSQARGDIRYLSRCFLQQGALRSTTTNDGTKIRCELEIAPEKFGKALPALAEMVREVRALQPEQKIRLTDWVRKYRRPPYGQGQIALALSLAWLRRFFGDSIRFKIDETTIGDLPITSFDIVYALLEGQYSQAFLSYRQLRSEEQELVNTVYIAFGTPDSAAARTYTVMEAYTALKVWWQKLPPLARVSRLYSPGQYRYTADFISVMEKIERKDAHSFLFDDLPTAFGADAGVFITQEIVGTLKERLPEERRALEGALSLVTDRILEAVQDLFEVKQSTYSDIEEGIKNWYNSLDVQQRDTYASWQNSDTKPLIQHLKRVDSLERTFLEQVSSAYALRSVQDWATDRVDEYVTRLKRGKERIDAHRLKVEQATILVEGQYTRQEHNNEVVINFKNDLCLAFQHTNAAVIIYVAEGQADPMNTDAPRQRMRPGESLSIDTNKTLKIAVQDQEGNWSQLQKIQLISDLYKHEIQIPVQPRLSEQPVTFVFPTNQEEFVVTCRSLFKRGIAQEKLTKKQCIEILQMLIEELGKES